MSGLHKIAAIAMLAAGVRPLSAFGPEPYRQSDYREPREHFETPKPLSKRAKRRLRGKSR